ncbi:elongation factor P [Candidatus Blochmannia vicinus]|uniref:Elongation factor P n=1 Tax=Candidatus Blochmannia vicinus (nom. nud.) TaxID=251540 RepID=A0A9Q8TVM9_9ENTR|nr:elongation factor P [Candidatus Blochmannia vicinus]URJ28098.1 elongation factor P [Candidatus Blochmannia vicinus]URJ30627.1 elongation factor P [Candidatus Blochmannia vicinus]URJ32772.1 elongation factor P [Candidatus Blochmannia vicinus]
MVLYSINELKTGLKIIQNDEPCVIISNESIKPGKGQSFNRVRFRQIISGKILEKTFKSGDLLRSADLYDISLIYVYHDNEFWYFMDEKNFEEIAVASKIIGDNFKWIATQLHYLITLWNKVPILITPPNCIELKVIKTTSIKKNNSRSSETKLATVNTGAMIKVPLFIQLGELIKINTRSGTYVSRAK